MVGIGQLVFIVIPTQVIMASILTYIVTHHNMIPVRPLVG